MIGVNYTPRLTACIAYATDKGYLFPTLLSAIQARSNIATQLADVIICFVGESSQDVEMVEAICKTNSIRFCYVAPATIDYLPAMYTRLFLDLILGSKYERVVYIDGDTQIMGSLEDLTQISIPAGMIMAVRDPMTFTINKSSRHWQKRKQYFETLGLSQSQINKYFNSGVIVFSLNDLSEIRARCLVLRERIKDVLRFPDQDLLNIALQGRTIEMSYKWNFPIYFLNHPKTETFVKPRIYHFMSNPRPWHGPFHPWSRRFFINYADLINKHPELGVWQKELPLWQFYKYNLQQRFKAIQEKLHWRSEEFLQQVRTVEDLAIT